MEVVFGDSSNGDLMWFTMYTYELWQQNNPKKHIPKKWGWFFPPIFWLQSRLRHLSDLTSKKKTYEHAIVFHPFVFQQSSGPMRFLTCRSKRGHDLKLESWNPKKTTTNLRSYPHTPGRYPTDSSPTVSVWEFLSNKPLLNPYLSTSREGSK